MLYFIVHCSLQPMSFLLKLELIHEVINARIFPGLCSKITSVISGIKQIFTTGVYPDVLCVWLCEIQGYLRWLRIGGRTIGECGRLCLKFLDLFL